MCSGFEAGSYLRLIDFSYLRFTNLENAGLAVEGALGGLEKICDLRQPRLFLGLCSLGTGFGVEGFEVWVLGLRF